MITVAACFSGLSIVSSSRAVDFTWTAGPDVLVPLLNSQDADIGIIQDGAQLSVQTALEQTWPRYLGTSLDNLVRQPDAKRDASFTQPNGDDVHWTNGMWQDSTGKRFAIVHIESNYAVPRTPFLWKRRIGLATSVDRGAHWHFEGDIITPHPKRTGAPSSASDFQDFGCGDTYLYVDRRGEYFYLYYMTAWVQAKTGWRTKQTMSVARAPISGKMAPGQWKKWHGGTWNEPGLGGHETAVFRGTEKTEGTDAAVVHFNTYLNTFVVIGHDSTGAAWINTAGDLAKQNWGTVDYRFPRRLYWYNWPIDPITNDRYEIGQTFRLYSAQANVKGNGTKYFNVTLSRNGNAGPTAHLIQPEENAGNYPSGGLTLIATASDADGTVAKVEFFANHEKIGELTARPYLFHWKNVPPGSYRLSVKSTDNTGAATQSAGVYINVTR